ncbi:MAG: hypothetical protein WBV94_13205 [Blastocatellia bacterium]
MLNKEIRIARWLISAIKSLFTFRGATSDGRINRSIPGWTPRRGSRGRVRYSYLASARRVHIGSVILKRFELNTSSGRRMVSRKFKMLRHGRLVAA